ncbi:MAG: hypothetical protein EOM20_08565 [Spartobacteria bacterium]|nr:hypothetical protein [Spartobacteria bacterium]
MLTEHVHEALSQVRQLQELVLDKQRFGGYSGPARALSGTIALLVSVFMTTSYYPQNSKAQILGWGGVFIIALFLNGWALIYWFLNDKHVNRKIWRLKPIMDSIPPLIVGGALTASMISHGFYSGLFGVWMCMFGLTNLASRSVLPRMIGLVGVFYIACGIAWLISPTATLSNPLPMGIVFFAGEWAGGLILYLDERRYLSFTRSQTAEDELKARNHE